MRVLKGNRKYCVVCAFWSGPIVRFANVVQHTNLRTGHGDGLRHSSGCLRREGSDASGRKPFDKLHGVALPEPQKLRDASQCSILTCSTEVRRMPQELARGQEASGTGWQRGNLANRYDCDFSHPPAFGFGSRSFRWSYLTRFVHGMPFGVSA